MDNKFIALAVGLTVGVIMLSGFLWPVVADATATETTFDNSENSLYYVEKITDETVYTFSWDHTNPTKATINGAIVALTPGTMICSVDNYIFRYSANVSQERYSIQGIPASTTRTLVTNYGTDIGDVNISIAAGTMTVEVIKSDTVTATLTVNEGYAIAASGSYVMKAPNHTAYMAADSPIVAMGLTTIDGVYSNMFQITGNVENVEVVQIYPNPATYTISNVVINAEEYSGYEGLYRLDNVQFLATQVADPTITQTCTYNYFIVPAEVTAEKSWHLDTTQVALIAAIGTLGAIVLIAAAAGSIRRLD